MNQRGIAELIAMGVAFVIVIGALAIGNGIKILFFDRPSEQEWQEQWMKQQEDRIPLLECPIDGVPATQCYIDEKGHAVSSPVK